MTDRSSIEWTDATWNPITGCTKVSPGCDHCYAETIAHRFAGTPSYPAGFELTLRPERLDQPLRWRRPRKVFVNSMSDLFHHDVPDAYIGAVFDVMARAEHHTFQLLTKRHGRMRSLLTRWAQEGVDTDISEGRPLSTPVGSTSPWTPPPNVWIGVSVETQQWADLRIPALRATPAAVRFLSCEPLLGPVHPDLRGIDWVIAGGESGSGARPMHAEWVHSLEAQCRAAGVPFFMKQAGTVLAREWGLPGKGADPRLWPTAFPQDYPQVADVRSSRSTSAFPGDNDLGAGASQQRQTVGGRDYREGPSAADSAAADTSGHQNESGVM